MAAWAREGFAAALSRLRAYDVRFGSNADLCNQVDAGSRPPRARHLPQPSTANLAPIRSGDDLAFESPQSGRIVALPADWRCLEIPSMNCLHRFCLGLALLGSGTEALLANDEAASMFTRGDVREEPIWPEGSAVLQQGMRALAKERNAVTHPSLLIYSPVASSSRAAVLVFPGGGFKAVAVGPQSTIGLDGVDVCRWLTDAGVTCVLVKYRVPNTGCNWNPVTRRHDAPDVPMALQDAQRAMSIVRHRAAALDIDPGRIGVLGFSAGGNLAVLSSTAFRHRAYAPIDEMDQASLRPDFAIPVYPGHMTMEHKNESPKLIAAQELNTDIVVSAEIPPTLLVHAKDDSVDPVHYSLVYARELRKAGVSVTLNLYENGGHAFGVRKQGADSDRWTDDALAWMKTIGVL
jgi:acetyl esterase/lipase